MKAPRFWQQTIATWMIYTLVVLPVRANPQGEAVVGGSASFDRSGSTLQITTSDRVIINWQSFSINPGELTQFIQPNSSSAALNRVISGDPSSILGSLQANGQVYLINPNGILVGNGAQINTASFIASTLDVNNADFMAGRDLNFSGNSAAGIQNFGAIHALGGDVFLIGRTVENAGSIQALGGVVGLAAGQEVFLKQSGDERLAVQLTPAGQPLLGDGIKNSGVIESAQAELKAHGNLYALAINNGGTIRASGAVNRDGRVILSSAGGTIATSGNMIANNVNGTGGKIGIDAGAAGTVQLGGIVKAGGGGVGDVTVAAGKVTARDTATAPLVLAAGRNLTLEGSNEVEIFALNHGSSGLFAGGDMVLRSDQRVSGDAHYFSGNFRVEKMDGSFGDLWSPVDPVIKAFGDVSLSSYTGVSLHILAGGSVNLGAVTITGAENSANPANYIAASITLSDGETLSINGSARGTLDIRAGIDWQTTEFAPTPSAGALGGGVLSFPGYPGGVVSIPSITVGPITMSTAGSQVFISNQYNNNGQIGNIILGNIYAGQSSGANGGSVTVDSSGNITAGQINTFSSFTGASSSGAGGDVNILSDGNLSVAGINTSSTSTAGMAGSGGDIYLLSGGTLSVTTASLDAHSSGISSLGVVGGGDIDVVADGAINLATDLLSSSIATGAGADDAAHGGDIYVSSATGGVTLQQVLTFSQANGGDASYGGDIDVDADLNLGLNNVVHSFSKSASGSSSDGGWVTMTAGGNMSGTAAADFDTSSRTTGSGTTARYGGDVDLLAGGSLTFASGQFIDTRSEAAVAGDGGYGGDIYLTSSGAGQTITVPALFSKGLTGGGNIYLTGDNISLLSSIQSSGEVSLAPYSSGRDIFLGAGGAGLSLSQATINLLQPGIQNVNIGDFGSGNVDIDTINFGANSVAIISGGDITLNGGAGTISSDKTLVFETTGDFYNNAGPSAITSVNERFLIYVQGPENFFASDLPIDFIDYDYGQNPPQSGNGLLFADNLTPTSLEEFLASGALADFTTATYTDSILSPGGMGDTAGTDNAGDASSTLTLADAGDTAGDKGSEETATDGSKEDGDGKSSSTGDAGSAGNDSAAKDDQTILPGGATNFDGSSMSFGQIPSSLQSALGSDVHSSLEAALE